MNLSSDKSKNSQYQNTKVDGNLGPGLGQE
jgi:hypothetical protein